MRIVVLDGYTLNPGDNPWDAVAALGELTVHDRTPREAIRDRAAGAHMVLTNKTPLDADTIAALPDLAYIGVLATGYDVVDIRAAAARSIPVCNVPGYGTEAVAQHVFAFLLELCRRIARHDASVKVGNWSANKDWCFWETTQIELTGKTMGIVGFGNMGKRVGQIANAFGMKVLAYSPNTRTMPGYEPFAYVSLDELFARSDVVTLHCPLTDATRGMVNRVRLASMKQGAILINTARGPLLDEAAVAAALNDNHLGGLGVDVVAVEPIRPDNPLLTAKNCLITPHLAWATLTARQTLMRVTADNIRAFLAGAPTNVVNAPKA